MKPEAMPMLPPKMRSWATMPWATAIKAVEVSFFTYYLDEYQGISVRPLQPDIRIGG